MLVRNDWPIGSPSGGGGKCTTRPVLTNPKKIDLANRETSYIHTNMSAVAKSASTKLNWAQVISKLGLTGSTASSLTSFKKRNDEAKKEQQALSAQSTEVDFEYYRSVLKNTKVVDEIEKAVSGFKPTTYDVSKTLKTIDIFEQKAIENAKLTEKSVLAEIEQLQATLKDIEGARPFDQLTVEDIAKARPDLDQKVTYMVQNGKWEVPGYKEKFGDLTVM